MSDKEYLQKAARKVVSALPDNHGFVLMTFPFGDQPDRRLGYVSNAQRADAIRAVKEWLFAQGQGADWMKHVK